MPFNRPVIPFGAIVEYHPISAIDQSRLHQFGPKVLPGISVTHYSGVNLERTHYGRRHWRIGGLEEMDASELHAQRLNAKEVWTPERSGNSGTVKIFGGEQRLRTSTLIRDRPERGEPDELRSPNTLQDDSTRNEAEAKNDFRSITEDFIYRHHVVPRCICRKTIHFLFRRSTSTLPEQHKHHLDVLSEKKIEDYWNVDGEKELSDAWTGFTKFVLLKVWGVSHGRMWPRSPSGSRTGGWTWTSRWTLRWTSGRLEGERWDEVEDKTGEEKTTKTQHTGAHAWMGWRVQGGLEPQVRCDTIVHQWAARSVLSTACCARPCARRCSCCSSHRAQAWCCYA